MLTTLRNVRNMLNEGYDVNYIDNIGSTELMKACYKGLYKLVQLLIEHGANVNNQDIFGHIALILACSSRNYDIVKLLLDNKADPNLQTINGYTALMVSFGTHDLKTAELLIYNGADVGLKNHSGTDAFLIYIHKIGKYPFFQILIEFGANIFTTDNSNNNSLIVFSLNPRDIQIAQYLINNGINVNHQNNDGITALMYACDKNNYELAKLLIESGANKNLINVDGKNALYYASNNSSPRQEIIDLFVDGLENVEYINEFTDQDCPICYDTLGPHYIKTTCGHYFHESCILHWKRQGKLTCPSCRTANSFFGYKKSRRSRRSKKLKK